MGVVACAISLPRDQSRRMGCGNSADDKTGSHGPAKTKTAASTAPTVKPPPKTTANSKAPAAKNWGAIIKGVRVDDPRGNLSIQEALYYALTGDPRAALTSVEDKDTPVDMARTEVEYGSGETAVVHFYLGARQKIIPAVKNSPNKQVAWFAKTQAEANANL